MFKEKISKVIKLIKKPSIIFSYFNRKGFFNKMSDEKFLKYFYKIRTGKTLNLYNPTTFNEKLQWLKIHDRKQIYTEYVDKYSVRKHVQNLIGKEYLIPLLGKFDSFDQINFNKLPNQFVLKCSHDSGGLVICKDKKTLDIKKSRKKIEKSLRRNYYYYGREWVYKNIKPRIICEEYLSDNYFNNSSLVDFKFYCFNGEPYYCQVIQGRGLHETIDFYDMSWNHMPFNGTRPLPMSNKKMEKPQKLNEMIGIARKLSQNIPFIRVDLYYVNKRIYFGELTFFPSSGIGCFQPHEWNKKLGELIRLPY